MAKLIKDERHEIQALIVTGYRDLPYSRYLFLRIDDSERAKTWLGQILGNITHAKWDQPDGTIRKPEWALNVGFTAAGFEKLGLPKKIFSQEFAEGMAEPTRAQRLGDTGASDPKRWKFGGYQPAEEKTIHVVLMVQTKSTEDLEKYCDEQLILFRTSAKCWSLKKEARNQKKRSISASAIASRSRRSRAVPNRHHPIKLVLNPESSSSAMKTSMASFQLRRP